MHVALHSASDDVAASSTYTTLSGLHPTPCSGLQDWMAACAFLMQDCLGLNQNLDWLLLILI